MDRFYVMQQLFAYGYVVLVKGVPRNTYLIPHAYTIEEELTQELIDKYDAVELVGDTFKLYKLMEAHGITEAINTALAYDARIYFINKELRHISPHQFEVLGK